MLKPSKPAKDELVNPLTGQWVFESTEYDELKFYTKSTDGQGQRDSVSIKVASSMVRLVSKLVESGKVPQYETHADFWRDAGVHRMHTLLVKQKILNEPAASLLRFEVLMQRAMEEEEGFLDYQQNVEHLAGLIRKLEGKGPEGALEARTLVDDLLSILDSVKDRKFWVKQYMDVLVKHQVHLAEYLPFEEKVKQ